MSSLWLSPSFCWVEMRVFSTDCGGLRRRSTARSLWLPHKTCSLADFEVQPQWTVSKRRKTTRSCYLLSQMGAPPSQPSDYRKWKGLRGSLVLVQFEGLKITELLNLNVS